MRAFGMLSVSSLDLLAEAVDGMAGTGAQPKNSGGDFQDKSDALFGSSIVFASVTATLEENIDTMDADGVAVGRGSAELFEVADSLDAAGVARAAVAGSMLEADDVAWMAGRAVPLLPPRRLSLSIAPQGRFGFQLARRDPLRKMVGELGLASIAVRVAERRRPELRIEMPPGLAFGFKNASD